MYLAESPELDEDLILGGKGKQEDMRRCFIVYLGPSKNDRPQGDSIKATKTEYELFDFKGPILIKVLDKTQNFILHPLNLKQND